MKLDVSGRGGGMDISIDFEYTLSTVSPFVENLTHNNKED